jgi:hypothetical protein
MVIVVALLISHLLFPQASAIVHITLAVAVSLTVIFTYDYINRQA